MRLLISTDLVGLPTPLLVSMMSTTQGACLFGMKCEMAFFQYSMVEDRIFIGSSRGDGSSVPNTQDATHFLRRQKIDSRQNIAIP